MRTPVLASLVLLAVASVVTSPDLLAREGQQRTAAPATSVAPARDLTGVWSFLPGDPGLSPVGSLTGVGRGSLVRSPEERRRSPFPAAFSLESYYGTAHASRPCAWSRR